MPLRMRALQTASASMVPAALWPIQDGLRRTLTREGKIDLAIFFGKQAVNTIQSLRGNLSSQDRDSQRAFLQDKSSVYRALADLLIDQGRLPEAQEVLAMLKEEELYDFLTRSTSEDNRKTSAGYNGIEETWHKRYQEISSKLGTIGAELDELDKKAKFGLSEDETKRREQLQSDRSVALQAFDKFLGDLMRELDSASRKRAREVGKRNLESLESLQVTLRELGYGAVTLHYVMVENKLKMILTTAAIQIARESEISSKDLNRKIQEFHALLSDPRKNPLPLAQELYKHLIGPVSDDLKQAKAQTLMVSLDGAMRYIPLAALHDGEKYLVEDYRISIYTEAARDKIKDDPEKQWAVAGLGLTRRIEGFDPLPSVRKEIEGIVKTGDRGVLPGEAHFDQEFNEQRLRHALDKRYPVLHIASHFVFKSGNESNSFLLLGDGKQLSLNVLRHGFRFGKIDLITLSACETAVGGGVDANGLEIEGFGALAQQKGASSVIATLWKVADESTGILMQDFYRIRESTKTTKIEALREAQLRFIRGDHAKAEAAYARRGAARSDTAGLKLGLAKPYAHPYYWAPFILMGNWK
jgi:CHAT domain-containing protein